MYRQDSSNRWMLNYKVRTYHKIRKTYTMISIVHDYGDWNIKLGMCFSPGEIASSVLTVALGVASHAAASAYITAKDVFHTLQAKNQVSYIANRVTVRCEDVKVGYWVTVGCGEGRQLGWQVRGQDGMRV